MSDVLSDGGDDWNISGRIIIGFQVEKEGNWRHQTISVDSSSPLAAEIEKVWIAAGWRDALIAGLKNEGGYFG